MEHYRAHNNIRKLRLYRGEMTQEVLAEKVGVTRQTIIAIEGQAEADEPSSVHGGRWSRE